MDPQRYDAPPPAGKTPAPGVYDFGLNEEFRRALNSVPGLLSYSRLKRHDDPDAKIGKYVAGVGNLVSDILLFGAEAALPHYFFWHNDFRANTKAGKQEQAEAQEQAGSRILIRPKQKREAQVLIERALGNEEVVKVLDAPGYCEAGLVANVSGQLFRAWLDKLTPKAIIDIKTSRCATPEEFLDSIPKYGYDAQAALYLDMAEELGLGQLNFAWIVVSKTSPRAWIQTLEPAHYYTGRRYVRAMIRSINREKALCYRPFDPDTESGRLVQRLKP